MMQLSGDTIRKKVEVFFLASLILLASVVFVAVAFPLYSRLRRNENDKLYKAVEGRALAMAQWRERTRELARQVGSRSAVRNALIQYDRNNMSLPGLVIFSQPKLEDAVKSSDEIVGIRRFAADGEPVATCGSNLPDSLTEYYAGSDTKMQLSHPVRIDGAYLIKLKNILRDSDANVIGRDEITMNLSPLREIFEKREGLGTHSSAHLFHLHGGKVRLYFPVKHSRWNDALLKFLDDSTVTAEFLAKGIHVGRTIVTAQVNGIDNHWGICIVQDKDELYAAIRYNLLFIILTTIAIVSVLLFLLKRLLSPLTSRFLLMAYELQQEVDDKTAVLQQQMREKERLNTELQNTIDQVKKLSGLIPICANCKKIRDDSGYWGQVEDYISEHSDARFSHGLCPECARELYPELYEKGGEGSGKNEGR